MKQLRTGITVKIERKNANCYSVAVIGEKQLNFRHGRIISTGTSEHRERNG